MKKYNYICFVSLLLLVTIFLVVPTTKLICAQSLGSSEPIKSKFEPWLWRKVQQLETNGTNRIMTIVVSVNCTSYRNNVTAYVFKNQVASLLAQNHNATILYIGKALSFVNVKIKVSEVKKIATYEFIDGLGDGEAEGGLCLDVSTKATRSDFVVNQLGYNGSGISVSVLDTGIDPNHPDFTGKTIIWRDFINGQPNPYDDHGHGTHCAGIVAGTGQGNAMYRGVALGIETLIIGKIWNQYGGAPDPEANALAGLDWAVSQGAQIISCSWGFQRRFEQPPWYCDGTCQICAKANECISKGVVVVVAAGNEGAPGQVTPDGYSSLNCPACASDVITVGATNDMDTVHVNDDDLALFPQPYQYRGQWYNPWGSSKGPTADNRPKPDVVAPGVHIWSCRSALAPAVNFEDVFGQYGEMSGTSMATPHVAGVAALLLQAHPGWTPRIVKSVVMGTARLNDNLQSLTENDRGKGIVDAERAVLCATDIPVDEAESKYEYGYGDYTAHAYLSGRYDLSAGTIHPDLPENYAIATLSKSFVPQHNLANPRFFFGFHDEGYMNTPRGWADFRAIFKLYAPDDSLLFMLSPQIHSESETGPCYFDGYHTIDYAYLGTLIAQQTYTIEYGFSTYAHYAYSDFDWGGRGAQALAVTLVDLVGVGNPGFEKRLMLAPGVYGVPYWSMNNDGWRELRGDCAPPGGDGVVSISDAVTVSVAYGSTPRDPNWNPYADFNGDAVVNVLDVIIVQVDFDKEANRIEGSYSWYTSGGGDYQMWQWLCDHDVHALKGQQVTFSFWFKPSATENNATAIITYILENGSEITISGNWVYATEDWHNANVTTAIPTNTVAIKVIIDFTGDFHAWIDKSSIELICQGIE